MKRALVISGGGSKGAFAIGVLKQLKNSYANLDFDIIVGTSTGALIAPLAALGELDLLEKIYTTQTTDKIITKHPLGDRLTEKSIYTVEPLWKLIQTYMTDDRYIKILKSKKKIYLVTTCLQTEGVVVYTTDPSPAPSDLYVIKTIKAAEHMRLAILASACQPVFMTPVKIDYAYASGPEKEYQYVDGGVREYAGIQMAIDQGAQEIFSILLSTGKADKQNAQYNAVFAILERTISMFSEDVQKNDVVLPQQQIRYLNYISEVKKKMIAAGVSSGKVEEYFNVPGPKNALDYNQKFNLFIIRPNTTLEGGTGGLVFEPESMKRMLESGRLAASDFIARLDPKDITWMV